ncbi:MAG TPA: hypothetical protein VGP02_14365 [Mycobacteriales bacterium]|nr:hypothetical protein [Mycobacteriales bacterium]
MRMTVGPLPPAVYWRRRAALAAALLAVLLGFTTCTAGGSDASSDQPAPTRAARSASPAPVTPPPARPTAIAQAKPGGTCTGQQLSLTAAPTRTAYRSGTMPKLRLVIQNVGSVACQRDLGADEQELRVMAGTRRVWSSDDCQPLQGRSVRTLAPGEKRTYTLTWSGKDSVPGCAEARTRVQPGRYEVVARLGSLQSERTPFTIS